MTSVRRCSFKVRLAIVSVPPTVPNAASFLRDLVHRGCKPYSGSSGHLGLSLGLGVSEADRRRGEAGLSLHGFIDVFQLCLLFQAMSDGVVSRFLP